MHIDAIRERFGHAPVEFGPTPFWFLNDSLDEGRLSAALEELKSKGVPGVIIHPRTGMEIEYLSDTFWERILFICETLKRLGMKGWLYDEYNWPSGPAGGKLLREHPEFKQVGLDYRIIPSSRIERDLHTLPGQVYAAYALSQNEVVDKTDRVLDRNFDFAGDALIFLLREAGMLTFATCCAPWARAETGYLDLLNPAAIDEFMRLTHFEYDRHVRRYYGDPIAGIFTDEPGNYRSLPFSRIMPDEFLNRHGEDLRACLPSLAGRFAGIPVERHLLNRTRYFELARDLYVQSYYKKMADWASERGLIFTGHLIDDDRIDRLPSVNISFFDPLSRMHMPGIDVLEDRHGFEKGRPLLTHANFTPKAVSSVSHHSGASRTLCEIWGGNGWATPPERLKAVLNWVQACGVNFVNPHAAFMSLRGLRKRDFPSSHFPPQPWWRFYKKFSDYIARLSMLNSLGRHVANVLFLFPLKGLWADFDLKAKKNDFADAIERASEALLRNQLDFDYLFDEFPDSRGVAVTDGRISIGEETYSLLVMPLNMVIPQNTLELAERFAAAGGKIVAFGYQLPGHDEYGNEVSDRMEALLGESSAANTEFHHLGVDGDSGFLWLVRKVKEWLREDLRIDGQYARNFAYLHRKTEDADCYFVANLSEEEGPVDLSFQCIGRPQIWNPDDGSTRDVLAYRVNGDYTAISRHFHPNEAVFFVILDEPPIDHVDSTNLTLTSVADDYAEGYAGALEVRINRGAKRYTRSVEQAFQPLLLPRRWQIDYPIRNILLLDEWDVEILSGPERPKWSPAEDPRLGRRAKLIMQGVKHAVSLGNALGIYGGNARRATTKFMRLSASVDSAERWSKILGINLEDFDEGEGILLQMAQYSEVFDGYDYPPPASTYAMSTTFNLEHLPEDLALVYEADERGPLSIEVNGHKINRLSEPLFLWDASNRAINISTLVRRGRNHLRMEWRQPDFPGLFPSVHGIEPVCLVGRFWVKKGKIVEQQFGTLAVPWTDMGLPNYIGGLTYRASFKLPLKYIGQQMLLKFDQLHVAAEVKINEKYAGLLLWRPYVLDVTNLVVQGDNAIEITVVNTAANLLGEPAPAGMVGRSYIVPYWRHRIRFAD